MSSFSAFAVFAFWSGALVAARVVSDPCVVLQNAAEKGMTMPAVGIGTGGYGAPAETWNDGVAMKAVSTWIKLGGRRIDTAWDYYDQTGIGKAVQAAISSGAVKREDLFIVSKTHMLPGYNDTLFQLEDSLKQLQVEYVDLFLIHLYVPLPNATDPNCRPGRSDLEPACVKSTWKAMKEIFMRGRKGGARSVGVSNFALSHLGYISDDEVQPSVNQVEYQPYWHEEDLVEFCRNRNITFNGYSPLGTPDFGPRARNWNCSLLELPLVKSIATAHNKSSAQVLLRWNWQQGIPVNPRSEQEEHMKENLAAILDETFHLTDSEMHALSNISPKPKCPKVCVFGPNCNPRDHHNYH